MTNTITITDRHIIDRSRSREPREDLDETEFINNTYYSEREKILDIGYQQLRWFNANKYHSLTNIEKLLIDGNQLTELPGADLLPNLVFLSCKSNRLQYIPYYPNLTYLNISHNPITNIANYNQAGLITLDCNYIKNIDLNIYLPKCETIYVSSCELIKFNIKYFQSIKILDCSNNKINELHECDTLIELSIENNKIYNIPRMKNLKRLFAKNNLLTSLPTLENAEYISIVRNNVSNIDPQPKLRELLASKNVIENLPLLPQLTSIDISHNLLKYYHITNGIKHARLHFNDVTIKLPSAYDVIKELQLDFNTYQKIHDNMKDITKSDIIISVDNHKLNKIIDNDLFMVEIKDQLMQDIKNINYKNKDVHIKYIVDFYKSYFSDKYTSRQFEKSIWNIYTNSLTIIILFNDHTI